MNCNSRLAYYKAMYPYISTVYNSVHTGDIWFAKSKNLFYRLFSKEEWPLMGIVWKDTLSKRIFIIQAVFPRVKISLWMPQRHEKFKRYCKWTEEFGNRVLMNALQYVDLYDCSFLRKRDCSFSPARFVNRVFVDTGVLLVSSLAVNSKNIFNSSLLVDVNV